MRKTWGILTAVVLVAPAWAAAAEVKTSEVTLKSGDEEIRGFLARPEGKGPFPGIVVIQEWWGLNDWIKDQAKRLAAEGYVALAPDLYRGKVADNPMMARQLMMGLPRDRALRDLKGAVSFLAARDDVKQDRIGTIGWCMGGGYALQLGLNDERVKAVAICYGRVETDPARLKSLHATAVLGIFGEEDRGIPAESVRQFEKAVKAADNEVDYVHVEIYQGAGHGFMRERNGPNKNPEYRAEAAKDAWQRIEKFFAKTLKG